MAIAAAAEALIERVEPTWAIEKVPSHARRAASESPGPSCPTRKHTRLGIRTLRLETGEPQDEAIGLYARAGYLRIPPFGEYVDDPTSVCMSRSLG